MSRKAKINYSSWNDRVLWEHQRDAVSMVSKYIESKAKGSALVRMPTGTGKSGVIAVLARCFETTPNVLVVVPWSYLREQLKQDIKKRFWNHINVEVNSIPTKAIKPITPSTIQTCLDETENNNSIFICTIQALQNIHSKDKSAYNSLKDRISLVIVDEGHREPAPEWSKAVRELNKPTVLLTATPYRNDHKMFNVNPEYIFAYTHQKAVEEKYIREVEFHEEDFQNSPEDFVTKLLDFHKELIEKKFVNAKDSRVIVRCETNTDVNKIALLLKARGQTVIAVHDRFPEDKRGFHRKNVPTPEKTDAIFWVHQYKLIEGIDDPRFCLLAIYQPLRNARALVQQIGRIIRNPEKKENQKAYVFTNPLHRQRVFWEGYRKYEEKFESNPELYEFRQIFDTIVQIQPEYQYVEGDYRKILDFKSDNLHKYLRYPLSANVYEVTKNSSIKELENEIAKEWFAKDLDIRKIEKPDDNTRVFIYSIYENSPILFGQACLEYKLGFTVFLLNENYLFFYDSQGNFCDWLIENAVKVEPKRLQKLFKGKDSRISEISLMNMDLGRHSIRRRTLHAHSIEDTAPSLVDYAHFVSTCRGYTERETNRLVSQYIGFTRARISEPSSQCYEYDDYIAWLQSIASALNSSPRKPLSLFGRYASFTNPPSNTTPINILIDIDEILDAFETSDEPKVKREALYFDELCYDIIGGKFVLKANSKTCEVNISYDPEKKIYRLSSPKLEIAYVRRDSNEKIRDNLIGYLNRTQSFRVIPQTVGVIYAHSRFYKPNLPIYGSTTKFDLLQIMYSVGELANIESEKGKICTSGGWENGSLFHLIDELGKGTKLNEDFGNIDILVCDDMGVEVADFIAADSKNNRVIFIHAKAFSKTRKSSAASLHEICSQSIKNLEILHPLSTAKPHNLKKWSGPWKSNIGKVSQRIRMCRNVSKNPNAIWEKIREIIRNPSSTREVWILLGSGLSLDAFKTDVHKSEPKPELVQIIYLLQSTWASVSSVGAHLKIFCSP